MQKIKKFWKKLKYWQKGAIIGLVFGILVMVMNESLPNFLNYPATIVYLIPDVLNCSGIECAFYFIIGIISSYLILGALIGLIIGKTKKK